MCPAQTSGKSAGLCYVSARRAERATPGRPPTMFDRRRILRLAEQYRARRRFHEAIREYRKVLELDPGDLSALHSIAEVELEANDPAAAAESFSSIADRLVARGWKLAAIHRLRRLLELAEKLPSRARHRSASAKVEALRLELATHRGTLSDYDDAALALENNGRDKDVADILTKMIALEPDNPVFHARLAETFCRMQRIEDALPVFRTAAQVLAELDRRSDVLRVLERILHLRLTPEDSLMAAGLYLERGGPQDAVRAVAKLQPCIAADAENLDALLLLARAFDAIEQPDRATQVRIEIARVAAEAGEAELLRDLLSVLALVAPEDSVVKRLSGKTLPGEPSAPSLSVRGSFVSVTDADLVSIQGALAITQNVSTGSVLDPASFEELDDVWLTPVISRTARRALDDADAFTALRLHAKAAYVLSVAVEEDPLSTELREALRTALKAAGDDDGFVDATVAVAELYRQRGFEERASTLVLEALAINPQSNAANGLSATLAAARREAGLR
jgi:tetratricopeptide (TPR) repeat protein